MDVNKLHKGYTVNPCWLHNMWCSSPTFNLHPKVVYSPHPGGGGEDPMCTIPNREGENCVYNHRIYPTKFSLKMYVFKKNFKNLPVGGRLRQFLPEWEKQGFHRLIIGLIKDGYKLPFRECPPGETLHGTLHNQQLCRLRQTKCLV